MILVNGAVSDTLPANDRGLAYGDGIFRTLRIERGRPRAWAYQYRKLEHDCTALAIPCPAAELLLDELQRAAVDQEVCAAKIIVTRGAGPRGYAPVGVLHPTRIVMSFPLHVDPEERTRSGIEARVCGLRLGTQPALAGIKHLNRLENVLARLEWNEPDIAEGLLLDVHDRVIGGTMSNLFIVESGALVTPDLTGCGVAGASREQILDRAAESGVACSVEHIFMRRLLAADEVFVVNSLIGVWPIRALAGTAWNAGTLTERVRSWLHEEDH